MKWLASRGLKTLSTRLKYLEDIARWRPLSEDSPILVQSHTNVAEHFSKISEDTRSLPKTFEEDPEMLRSYTKELKYNLRWLKTVSNT